MDTKISADICIIGGGSGGFGAALRAARTLNVLSCRKRIVLLEKYGVLGGTSTIGGVNNWEPGIGGHGVHSELASGLLETGGGGNADSDLLVSPELPCAISSIKSNLKYEDTLIRAGVTDILKLKRFQYESGAMSALMKKLLLEAGADIYYNTEFIKADTQNGKIVSVEAADTITGETINVSADIFIDCTGNIAVARSAGCAYMTGEDSEEDFGEYSAPKERSGIMNGATLIFKVTPSCGSFTDEIPAELAGIDVGNWYRDYVLPNRICCFCLKSPNGDIICNMLPTMDGAEFFAMGEAAAMPILKARVYHYLRWLQTEKRFGYRMKEIFPMAGVREDYRLRGRYVLTENEIRKNVRFQEKRDEIIAFADHTLDTHGANRSKNQLPRLLNVPYGIPYGCLLAPEAINLLVACRGASFTHLAASSCRLSRTVMAMGEAAGAAAALSVTNAMLPVDVPVGKLREILKISQTLSWIDEKFKA